MQSLLRSIAVTALVLATAACSNHSSIADPKDSSPREGIVAGTLQATVANGTVTLRNTTEFVVGYMVIDKDMMTIALFPPCGATCPTLVQGAQVSFKYSQIGGYTARSTEANVLWWTYMRAADGTLRPTGGTQVTPIKL